MERDRHAAAAISAVRAAPVSIVLWSVSVCYEHGKFAAECADGLRCPSETDDPQIE